MHRLYLTITLPLLAFHVSGCQSKHFGVREDEIQQRIPVFADYSGHLSFYIKKVKEPEESRLLKMIIEEML